MGCSSSRSNSTTTPDAEDLNEMSWPEVLCGKQGGKFPSTSTTISSTGGCTHSQHSARRSRTQSPQHSHFSSKAFGQSQYSKDVKQCADELHIDDTMETDWPGLLCGTQTGVQSTATTRSTAMLDLTSETTSEERADSKESPASPKSNLSPFSLTIRSSTNREDPSHFRFDLLQVEELRNIQVEIFHGMLIAFADSGDVALGARALPCDPKVALVHCQRAISEVTSASYVLALRDLIVSFKGALMEAGLDRNKILMICEIVRHAMQLKHINSSKGKTFINNVEVAELVKTSISHFQMQQWNEFGYSTGRLALQIVEKKKPE